MQLRAASGIRSEAALRLLLPGTLVQAAGDFCQLV